MTVSRYSALISLPTYVGSRTGVWDGTRRTYNLHAGNSLGIRAALAGARGGTGLCRIVLAGDSITAGYPLTIGEQDPTTVLRKLLGATGVPVGSFCYATNSSGTPDVRWSLSGWSGTSIVVASGAGNTATFTSDCSGTVVDIEMLVGSANFTYSIDGATPVAVNSSGVGDTKVLTLTGLQDTPHRVVITSVTGTNHLVGVGVRYPTGLDVINAGQVGIDTAEWLASGYGVLTTSIGLSPDAVLLELGVNDWGARSVAAYSANMQTIIDAYVLAGVTVVLGATHRQDFTASPDWPDYLAAIYDLADANDLPLLDFTDLYGGTFAAADAAGLMNVDGSHSSAAGNALRGQAWANVLDLAPSYGGGTRTDVYDTPGTFYWRKPPGCTSVRVNVIGSGSGGGSGRRGAAATRCDGGSGGAGGGRWETMFPADLIDDLVTVTVGAGGAGGAARTANDTDGAAGSVGGSTSFGTHLKIAASFGAGGGGTAAGSGTVGLSGMDPVANGAAGGAGAAGTGTYYYEAAHGASGGGGGGGISAGNTAFGGGETVAFNWSTGVADGYGNGGAVNGVGATGHSGALMPGSGGSGGGASLAGAGGAGGAGGTYGGGGGGGGASRNGQNSGAGGTGGDGLIVVTALF